jgi:hypothetical protein
MRHCLTEDIVGHAIEEAYFEIAGLGDDMRDVFDRTPEQFKDNIGRSRELAADLLEAVSPPSVPKSVENEQITWLEKLPSKNGRLFRPARRDNATSALKACIGNLSRLATADQEVIKLREHLLRDVELVDSVFFPGMTGR